MHKPLTTSLMVVAMLLLTPPLVGGQVVSAQTAGDVARELDDLEDRIAELEEDHLKPALLGSRYKLDARYNDARVAYATGDYHRAAILLVDVVRSDEFKARPSYREALYLLGDSLFRMRNYVAARAYFQEVLDLGPGDYYDEAAARRLEIAYDTRDFAELDQIHASLRSGTMSGAIAYLAGKAFYERGNYQKARDSFARAAQTTEYALLGEYFRGVTFVAEKKIGDAKRTFDGIVRNARPQDARDVEVHELSWLALGRLAYEEGDVELALDYYGRIGRTSEHFDRALWEQTWVQVSRGKFEAARRQVDILLYLPEKPDPDLLADARLLRADLSLKLGEYDTARADYESVLDSFGPVHAEMDKFVSKHTDLSTFFAALARDELGGETDEIPPLVREWMSKSPEMRGAAVLLTDVADVERDLRDTDRMLDEISTRLDSTSRAGAFPDLATGLKLGHEVQNRLLLLRDALVRAQFEKAKGQMSSADQQTWRDQQKTLDRLRTEFQELPETKKKIAEYEDALAGEFSRLRKRLDTVESAIDAQQAQINAVEAYMSDEEGRELTNRERSQLAAERAALQNDLAQMTQAHEALQGEVDRILERVGVAEELERAEAEFRQRYEDELDQAEQFLSRFGLPSAVRTARAEIPGLQKRLDAYLTKMNRAVDTKLGELEKDVSVERELMEAHRESMQQLVSASRDGAGVLAYLNFMKARARFGEIMLRGEVGVIDVVWQKKEDMSNKISKLFEDRTSELNVLQEAFEEVR